MASNDDVKNAYPMKFLDGTKVDDAYATQIARVVGVICDAEELVGADALEEFAARRQTP